MSPPAGFTSTIFAAPSQLLVQSAVGAFSSSVSTATFAKNNIANNLLVCATFMHTITGAITTGITDSASNSWVEVASSTDGSTIYCDIWSCYTANSYVAGNIVTPTISGTFTDFNIAEFSLAGLAGNTQVLPWQLDTSISNTTGSGTQPTVDFGPVLYNYELVVTSLLSINAGGTITPDLTAVINTGDVVMNILLEYGNSGGNSAGNMITVAPTLSIPLSSNWIICPASYSGS